MTEYKFTSSDQTVTIIILSDSEEAASVKLLDLVLEPLDYILEDFNI